MRLFDSHCHPLSHIKKGKVESWLNEIKAVGLEGVIAIGTDLADWTEYRNLASAHPDFIHYTVGLHPGYVTEGWEETVAAISPYFADTRHPVALGEIGLDGNTKASVIIVSPNLLELVLRYLSNFSIK